MGTYTDHEWREMSAAEFEKDDREHAWARINEAARNRPRIRCHACGADEAENHRAGCPCSAAELRAAGLRFRVAREKRSTNILKLLDGFAELGGQEWTRAAARMLPLWL